MARHKQQVGNELWPVDKDENLELIVWQIDTLFQPFSYLEQNLSFEICSKEIWPDARLNRPRDLNFPNADPPIPFNHFWKKWAIAKAYPLPGFGFVCRLDQPNLERLIWWYWNRVPIVWTKYWIRMCNSLNSVWIK